MKDLYQVVNKLSQEDMLGLLEHLVFEIKGDVHQNGFTNPELHKHLILTAIHDLKNIHDESFEEYGIDD